MPWSTKGGAAMAVACCLLVAACSNGKPPPFTGRCPAGPVGDGEPEVTFESLLAEMRSLEARTRSADPPFVTAQSSSYDRSSIHPSEDGWFANYDRGSFEREFVVDGRTEQVMLDARGPGAIVRLWTANPQGTLRVYLDCDPEPVIEVSMADLFDGSGAPFAEPFAYAVTVLSPTKKGANLYLPIPYQRRVLVTTDAGLETPGTEREDMFFEVGYRTYREGTSVRTFSMEQAAAAMDELDATASALSEPEVGPAGSAALETREATLSPGDMGPARETVEAPAGGAVLRELTLRPAGTPTVEQLRAVDLELTFDGERTVAMPLPDFFAGGPSTPAYESLPMGIDEDGTMVSRWPMPFRHTAEIAVRSARDDAPAIELRARWEPRPWDERSMYLHAGWRSSGAFVASRQDRRVIEVRGQGVLVGSALTVVNGSECWWGEGDERIWVDGESFPSHFGTGTEDFYGYAWALPEVFHRPYHAQTRYDAGRGVDGCRSEMDYGGVASMNRWHLLDAIPFERELRFDLEVWHWSPEATMAMSTTAYWYARPGATDDAPPADEPPRDVLEVGDLASP